MVATVVPVSFILTKKNWKVPWIFEWGIPVLGDREIAVGDALSAAFAIPLPQEKLRLMSPGEYAAYMVMEGRLYGPEEFSVLATVR